MKLTQELKDDYETHAFSTIQHYHDDETFIQFQISIDTFIPDEGWDYEKGGFDAWDYEDELGEIFDECALW